MREIKEIVGLIEDEIEAAEEYAEAAERTAHDDLRRLYIELAEVELGHITKLHSKAVHLIEEYKSKGHTPPVAMQAVWDHEHERMMRDVTEIKMRLDTVEQMH